MRAWKRATLSAVVASVAVVAMLLFSFASASAASAAGAGAVSYTQTYKDATDSFSSANPCTTGVTGTVTETYNGVFHVTELTAGQGAGTLWATGTLTGTFVFTPDDATEPSYTGHFTTWFGDNNNLQNGTETVTFSIHGTGSDGSTLQFHEVTHMSVSATGTMLFFDKPMCG